MTTIYMKSKDEHTVMSIRGRDPVLPPQRLMDEGFTQITPKEFRRIKQRIERNSLRVQEPVMTVSVTPVVDACVFKAKK